MATEPLAAHPAEIQVWLFVDPWRARMARRFRAWRESPAKLAGLWRLVKGIVTLGVLIQGEDGWGDDAGNHMAFRFGDNLYEADWPCVKNNHASDALARGSTIHAFAFRPPLTRDEAGDLLTWLGWQLGKPYDVACFGLRAVAALRRLRAFIATGTWPAKRPAPDPLGALAFICYELVARGAIAMGRGLGHPDAFSPSGLWAAARDGNVLYRGIVQGDPS